MMTKQSNKEQAREREKIVVDLESMPFWLLPSFFRSIRAPFPASRMRFKERKFFSA